MSHFNCDNLEHQGSTCCDCKPTDKCIWDNPSSTSEDKQQDITDFIKDPENIKKAVEGSMDRRIEVMTNSTSPIQSIDEWVAYNPFDFVESCEPDCSEERHAYHEGQWDMAVRICKYFGVLPNPADGDDIPKNALRILLEAAKEQL